MKYKQNIDELTEQWNGQIGFIKRSCESYDAGIRSEAKRIATSMRILFLHTQNSNSLFNQLAYTNNFLFWSSANLYTPSNLLSSWSLLSLQSNGIEMLYIPRLKEIASRTFFLELNDWWNEIIFDDKQFFLSRKDIVLAVSNKDGGAHVDPEFDESYANITKRNSLGFFIETNKGSVPPNNNPAYASVRQIACEVLYSCELFKGSFKRTPYLDRKFEMRFIDNSNKRFKWSTTDITASEETKNIINKYKFEPRKYYIDQFDNGIKREVIIQDHGSNSN